MKDKITLILACILGIVMLSFCIFYINGPQNPEITKPSVTKETIDIPDSKKINVNHNGNIISMDMEEYLINVVAGEVYPTFLKEAVKAQAVAARTYLLYKMENGGCAGGGDICTMSTHCQAYKTNEDMVNSWGEDYEKYYSLIQDAVYSTKGEIITYENKPICALYHSLSYGKTEDSVSVFGGTQPYLTSVSSPVSEEIKEVSQTFSKADFLKKVNEAFSLNLTEISIKIISYTSAGRVSTLKLGEKSVKATALRKALNLRSTDFTFEILTDGITFHTKGYGHGVGLSQFGANELAKGGKTYKEILTHYYTGTNIQKLKSEQ